MEKPKLNYLDCILLAITIIFSNIIVQAIFWTLNQKQLRNLLYDRYNNLINSIYPIRYLLLLFFLILFLASIIWVSFYIKNKKISCNF